MINNTLLNFYKKTSVYTELGVYNNFFKDLPDDISKLCILQRKQIIHPVVFKNSEIRNSKNCFWGDMTQISSLNILREDDILPTALSMVGELLRKNSEYGLNREAKDKLFITCRGQAILLTATLKAKKIPARVRSVFAEYPTKIGVYLDHWITEYYDADKEKWIFVDADCCCNDNLDFDIYDIPKNKFLTAAQVWVLFRQRKLGDLKVGHAYYNENEIIKTLTTALFYDFHCLMNDEIIYLHYPKYLRDKDFDLSDKDLLEIDDLAKLMLDPNNNFELLHKIWNTKSKFRIMSGGTIN